MIPPLSGVLRHERLSLVSSTDAGLLILSVGSTDYSRALRIPWLSPCHRRYLDMLLEIFVLF